MTSPMSVPDNPLAVLTLIAAPAVFTNASSVLVLGTGNRLARVVDRARYIAQQLRNENDRALWQIDRKSTRLNSSHGYISYAVFCLNKKNEDDLVVIYHN